MAVTDVALGADADSFHRFHTVELPRRLAAGNGALAFADLAPLGTLGLSTPAGSYTYVPVDGTVEVVEGTGRADTVISMELDAWFGLVSDLDTAPGLFYSGRVEATHGKPLRFVRWEPGLRAMFHGLAPFDPANVDLRDRTGEPLDPTASFTLADVADRPEDVAHFLGAAGYVVVRGVFSPEEVEALLADAAVMRTEATPGDGRSWWGRTADGEEVLCRVLDANRFERYRALGEDPRILALRDLVPEPLVGRDPDALDSGTVLWKLPNVTEGLADLPWHRDCGLGGHALNCPTVIVTTCLTEGTPEAGELRVLPGSHRGTYPFIDGRRDDAPRGVSLEVRAGDVSLHYSDLMHASLPPTSEAGPHRISVLLAFVPPTSGHHLGGRHYNDVLLGAEDGQVEHLGTRFEGSSASPESA
ncbi:MAG: phytanoyl-CoA dioxygenase family protein [Acidimicrobiales bacterium]|jgi:ectoine hydroxylase-related dioxygenase (phytanoyl-CoA dioxygenase family)|nr:phytanoyl-CoA dioxygenase family protein [Acidimicrobiales bacterium]